MTGESVIGWDVGGAHLKAARIGARGKVEAVVQLACPLWQGMGHLHTAMDTALAQLGSAHIHAVTMTGEMVDLFPDRTDGVAQLVAAMQGRAPDAELLFYAGAAGFLPADCAALHAADIASANWLASATCVAARIPDALFLDIGSTTTDLIPIVAATVAAQGRNDYERLVSGELLYTGVCRTPLMALAPAVPFEGAEVPMMAEHFATSADIYRLTEQLPDGADLHPAADGGEKTIAGSARRLARMIGRDAGSAEFKEWRQLAGWLADVQRGAIADACIRLCAQHQPREGGTIVGAGVGRFIAGDIALRLGWSYLDFADLIPHDAGISGRISDCAPAVAVAWQLRQT